MTKWGKKFIVENFHKALRDRDLDGTDTSRIKHNAAGVEKAIGFPAKLWIEVSRYLKSHRPSECCSTSFAAGMAVGWNEARRKKR